MKTELYLYLLTKKYLDILPREQAEQHIINILAITPDVYGEWFQKRFPILDSHPETLVAMLRSAGYTYRFIQNFSGMGPNRISRIEKEYQITYEQDSNTYELTEQAEQPIEQLEKVANLYQMGGINL